MIELGQSSTLNVTLGGGAAPYQFSWQGLPTGCVAPAGGVLTCTPSETGTFNVGVTVKDSAGDRATTVRTLEVLSPSSSTPTSGAPGSDWPLLAALVLAALTVALVALKWIVGRPRKAKPAEVKPTPSATTSDAAAQGATVSGASPPASGEMSTGGGPLDATKPPLPPEPGKP